MPIGFDEIGGYVPPNVVTNDMLIARGLDTTADWIASRTGVVARRYADPGTATSDLAHRAVDDLCARRPNALDDVGAIVVATSTPDQPQPATAARLQALLDLPPVMTLDVNAVCSGFTTALAAGGGLIAIGVATRVLVVAADLYSPILDPRDRNTVTLFGDGAAAVVLSEVPEGLGFAALDLVTHGQHADLVGVPGGGSRAPLTAEGVESGAHYFRMEGSPVTGYVLDELPKAIERALAKAGITVADVDLFACHQANPRLVRKVAARAGFPAAKVPIVSSMWGNSGCASAPLALWSRHGQHPLAPGSTVVIATVGGGLTTTAVVLKWG